MIPAFPLCIRTLGCIQGLNCSPITKVPTMADEHPAILLKKKRKRLITEGLKTNCAELIRLLSDMLDAYFCEVYEKSIVGPTMRIERNPYALVALGGYGRREECVQSDVDLLFLFDRNVPENGEALIREIIYPLWDIGVTVGHATRSIDESLELAATDLDTFTAMLDSRLICGMSPLFSTFMERFRREVILPNQDRWIETIVKSCRERRSRFGDSAYLLEPNIKEGVGSLRDYHTFRWMAMILSEVRDIRDLEYYGYVSSREYGRLIDALNWLWIVRNHLHDIAGRKCDRLYFEYQPRVARRLGFIEGKNGQPVEQMLSKVHSAMEWLNQLVQIGIREIDANRSSSRNPRSVTKTTSSDIYADRGTLHFSTSEAIVRHPVLLIRIFEESAKQGLPLCIDARRLVQEFLYLVNEAFLRMPGALKAFESILMASRVEVNVLEEMASSGMLERLIPEFTSIRDRIQYDRYHLFSVDAHSLKTVQAIKSFGAEQTKEWCSLCAELYRDISSHRKWLLWAALLHDIGKGVQSDNHSRKGAEIARSILNRLGYRKRDIDTVAFLIEHHLLLIKTATRRDINDEEVAITCGRTVNNVERLKMLYLLTVADSMSTGPKAWNEWTAALLRDLFFKVLNIVERKELAGYQVVRDMARKKAQLFDAAAGRIDRNELERIYGWMSPRYLLYAEIPQILEHVDLYRGLESRPFIWRIQTDVDTSTRTVTICARDRPGLFSKIAGVLTLNGMNILNAQVFTWRNNTALDIFHVSPPVDAYFEGERWMRAERNLEAALKEQLDLPAAIAEKMASYGSLPPPGDRRPPRVKVDNTESSFFTIIEVFSDDFPGLLFWVTDAIFRLRLDIWLAKISTKVDQILDVFYVRDFDGQKADAPEQVEEIQKTILDTLDCIMKKGGKS
uniref:Bifunctional uridylyltransferase/uridylyl-removing enzyme n=1 Tax=Desulfatirhabdium butyrativorans TaxID=340467 RepID=A0A7C4RSH8_9BACT